MFTKGGRGVQGPSPFDALKEGFPSRGRQHQVAILVAFAFTIGDLTAFVIDVLPAQPEALHQPQASAVHQPGHQRLEFRGYRAIEGREKGAP